MGIRERIFGQKVDAPTPKAEIKGQYAPAVMDQPFGNYWNSTFTGGYNNYANSILRQEDRKSVV